MNFSDYRPRKYHAVTLLAGLITGIIIALMSIGLCETIRESYETTLITPTPTATCTPVPTATSTPKPTVAPPSAVLKPTVMVEPTVTPTPAPTPMTSLGEFMLTAYCSCEKCCGKWAKSRPKDSEGKDIVWGAGGYILQAGYSIAVDPTVIAYGTEVIINGHIYRAEDCGSAIKGNHIDVYFDSHEEAKAFEVQYAEIFLR